MSDESALDLTRFAAVADLLGTESPVDPRFFMSTAVSPGAVAAVLRFAFPAFVEYRGAVLLEYAFDQAGVDEWFAELGDPVSVERIVNHVHLWDVLGPTPNLPELTFCSV